MQNGHKVVRACVMTASICLPPPAKKTLFFKDQNHDQDRKKSILEIFYATKLLNSIKLQSHILMSWQEEIGK